MIEIRWRAKDVGTITDFLNAAECDEYIQLAEAKGFDEAPVSTHRGMVMMKELRNNDRVMIDDVDRAQQLYRRLSPHLPSRFNKTWQPIGLNERLRVYRYNVGQQFDWHLDGSFERPSGEQSFFTFMVYLNADFEGGATSFKHRDPAAQANFCVTPRQGMALVFHHPIEHRGDPVTAGRKYVLRTDIMHDKWLRVEK